MKWKEWNKKRVEKIWKEMEKKLKYEEGKGKDMKNEVE